MKRLISCVLALIVLGGAVAAALPCREARASDANNPLFAYTHLLPSPFTLPAGRFVVGTSSAFGVTDFFQVGTNLIRDFYKIYNANAKLSLVDTEVFAMGIFGEVQHYNLRDISDSNPDAAITSYLPGLVTSYALLEELALFVGGNLNYTKVKINEDAIATSGYVRGAVVESDLSWAYNPRPPTQKGKPTPRGAGNVLSVGASYDFTYKLFGVGLSHHWPGLQLGIHYYPNAERRQLLPIIAGGAVVDF